MKNLLIITAVVGLSLVTISAWQNWPCGDHCRAAKVEQLQQQMVKCAELIQLFDHRDSMKCINDLTARIERLTQ